MGQARHTSERRAGWHVRVPLLLAAVALAIGLGGCAEYKKLSRGGSIPEVFIHDILGQDRPPQEYYTYVRDSHREEDFCYRCGTDSFIVDKSIDAVQRLGDASFGRLEGEAQVVLLFTEVLLEDPSSMARASAANSLTKIGLKLPRYDFVPVEDDGSKFLAMMQELDRIHANTASGAPVSQGARARTVQLVTAIGNLEFAGFLNTRNAIKLFYDRAYLKDAGDPNVRAAIDTALVKRMRVLLLEAMRFAVDDKDATVRVDAIRGLKTLGDRASIDTVLQRLAIEPQWLVQIEAIEYVGKLGTRDGVVALVRLLGDPNASVRHKARGALTRIAGADYGARRESWMHWARKVDPSIDFGDLEPAAEDEAASDGEA